VTTPDYHEALHSEQEVHSRVTNIVYGNGRSRILHA